MRYLGFLPAATSQRRLALRRCLRQRRREARHKLAQVGRPGKNRKENPERRRCDTCFGTIVSSRLKATGIAQGYPRRSPAPPYVVTIFRLVEPNCVAGCTAGEGSFRNPRITNTKLKNNHVERSELMSPVFVAFTIPTASNAAHTCDNAKCGAA